jgi:hypothetical protein
MLTPLIDRTRQPLDKGPPLTTRKLADIAGVPEDVTGRALRQLETDEILRKRGDGEAETAWQLDHAYLAQSIIRIERERDHWRHLLSECARVYAEAGWPHKWGALLPIHRQLQLLAARLAGRFRYGEYKLYALKSLARGLPIIVGLALATGLAWAANEWGAAARIETQLAVIDSRDQGRLTDDAAAALDDLTTRGRVARWYVGRDIFNSPAQAGWFHPNANRILRALIRLDSELLDELVSYKCYNGGAVATGCKAQNRSWRPDQGDLNGSFKRQHESEI